MYFEITTIRREVEWRVLAETNLLHSRILMNNKF